MGVPARWVFFAIDAGPRAVDRLTPVCVACPQVMYSSLVVVPVAHPAWTSFRGRGQGQEGAGRGQVRKGRGVRHCRARRAHPPARNLCPRPCPRLSSPALIFVVSVYWEASLKLVLSETLLREERSGHNTLRKLAPSERLARCGTALDRRKLDKHLRDRPVSPMPWSVSTRTAGPAPRTAPAHSPCQGRGRAARRGVGAGSRPHAQGQTWCTRRECPRQCLNGAASQHPHGQVRMTGPTKRARAAHFCLAPYRGIPRRPGARSARPC